MSNCYCAHLDVKNELKNWANIIGQGIATLSEPSRLIKEKYGGEYLLMGFIENVFVEEPNRGQGIGTKIIKELEQYL